MKKARFLNVHTEVNSGKLAALDELQAEYTSYVRVDVIPREVPVIHKWPARSQKRLDLMKVVWYHQEPFLCLAHPKSFKLF